MMETAAEMQDNGYYDKDGIGRDAGIEGNQYEGDGSSITQEYNEGQQQPSYIRLPRRGVDKETVLPGGIRMQEVLGSGSDWRNFIFR